MEARSKGLHQAREMEIGLTNRLILSPAAAKRLAQLLGELIDEC